MKHLLIAGTALLMLTACSAANNAADATKDAAKTASDKVGAASSETAEKAGDAMKAVKTIVPSDAVITTESGLKYDLIQAGLENGATAAPGQGIAAHYHGFFPDGKIFDSSYERGAALRGPSNGFIKGWNEALGEMKVCEARTLYIKPDLAYGARDRGPIPGGSTLYFHMQLLEVQKVEESADVYKCPEDKILSGPEAY